MELYMQGRAAVWSVLTASLVLSGCTTSLQTRLDTPAAAVQTAPRTGVTYSLPMRRYDISVTRLLVACNTSLTDTALDDSYVFPTLAFVSTATSSSKLIPGERYVIDYEALNHASKITEFKIEYHPGGNLLKSVNASADDQTAEIIGKTLAVAGVIALSAASPAAGASVLAGAAGSTLAGSGKVGFQGQGLAPSREAGLLQELVAKSSKPTPTVICAPGIAEKVVKRKELGKELERLENGSIDQEWADLWKKVAKPPRRPLPAGATLSDLNDRLLALLPYLGMRPPPAETSADIDSLLLWQAAVLAKARAIKTERTTLDKDLATVTKLEWPIVFSDARTDGKGGFAKLSAANTEKVQKTFFVKTVDLVDPADVAAQLKIWKRDNRAMDIALLRLSFGPFLEPYFDAAGDIKTPAALPTACFGATAAVAACLDSLLQVEAEIARAPDPNGLPATPAPNPVAYRPSETVAADGLFIRPPVMAVLKICPNTDFKPVDSAPASCARNIIDKPAYELVPQLGEIGLLKLKNSAFQNNGLSVAVAEDGRLLSFAYMNKRAIGAAIAATAADAATQYQAYAKAAQDKEDAARKRAREDEAYKITNLQNQIDEKTKTDELEQKNKDPAPKSDIQLQMEKEAENTTILRSQLLLLLTQQCVAQAKANPLTPTTCPAD
jgi:hypothetical protein